MVGYAESDGDWVDLDIRSCVWGGAVQPQRMVAVGHVDSLFKEVSDLLGEGENAYF